MLLRLSLAALLGVRLFAQSAPTDLFDKAPPDVDEALRARVTTFFQAHVDGKFRQAEAVVAEDSKDFFYNMEKSKYLNFEILKISYDENFTKALVVTGVEVEWRSARMGVMRVKPPMNSLWKVENGQWFWYVKNEKQWDTPFGKMSPGPDAGTVLAQMKGVNPEMVLKSVHIDKSELKLSGYEKSTAELSVSNGLPGQVRLDVMLPSVPGLKASFDKTTLQKGEVAKLTFTYDPPNRDPKEPRLVNLLVQPTNQKILVRLSFAVPPEVQKEIPAGFPKEPLMKHPDKK